MRVNLPPLMGLLTIVAGSTLIWIGLYLLIAWLVSR